jgi:hypothetical protein
MTTVSEEPEGPEEYEPTGPEPTRRDDADEGDVVEQVSEIPDDEADDYR